MSRISLPVPAQPPSPSTPYRIAFVCLGNICRSPMAHVVMEQKLVEAGLGDLVEVTSSGTGGWHRGNPMDHRAAETLSGAGYDPSLHRARQFDRSWFDRDLILVMDRANLRDVNNLGDGPVLMFRDFDPAGRGEVPDPYYGGAEGFDNVLAMVERTCAAIVVQVRGLLRQT
ncbi:MAG TPA: low molecular weight protein-tyrosine-phosphatase [Marmoricola sp.]|nr:low molecular weight protein-tyrosine-phosphatase [Marmoricola sp.]